MDVPNAENSYGLNELAFVDLTDETPEQRAVRNYSEFQAPADTIMLGDTGIGDDFMTIVPNAYKMVAPSYPLDDELDARPSRRHFDRANIGFVDGHAKSRTLEQYYLNQSPPDRYFTP